MLREIKFRGLRADGGGWVYGSLVNNGFFNSETKESILYIFNPEECKEAYGWEDFDDDYGYYQVIPESLGQFTGIHDNNGTEIYEGDLLEVCENKNGALEVEFINDYVGGWVLSHNSTNGKLSLGARKSKELEVIGNIHQK